MTTHLHGHGRISSRGVWFLGLWALGLITAYLILGAYSIDCVTDFRNEANQRHRDRLDPAHNEAHLTQPVESVSGGESQEVMVGIYLDYLSGLSLDNATWSPNFYLWFRWADERLHPGETFRILGGQIEEKQLIEETTQGPVHYARYFVRATLSKNFSVSLFPVEQHLMTIAIEDAKAKLKEVRYRPDVAHSHISSRAHFAGFQVVDFKLIEKPHSYRTDFGETVSSSPVRGMVTHDEVILGVTIERKGYGLYIKYFIGLFSATLIALIAFFIKPTDVDPRFGLGVGGFFGAVANALLSDNFVGQAESLSFIDIINGIGLFTIFLSIVESTVSLYLYDIRGQRALARSLDVLSAVILGMGFLTLILMLPVLARWNGQG